MFICARGENFGFAREIGVGLVESASLLTSIVLKENPQCLIFVGSAGSYDESVCLLDIFISSSATQIEYSFTQNKSYTPIDNKIEIVSYETLNNQAINHSKNRIADSENRINITAILNAQKFPRAIVNSSNYICTDLYYAKQMKNAGILLENMEFFSVLKVADCFKIPSFGIFCVTNYCDKNAHNDFLANHKNAQKALESNARQIYDKYF